MNIPVTHASIRQLKEETLLDINSQNMKERNIPVTYVTIKQLKEETLLNIRSQSTKAKYIPVTHVTKRAPDHPQTVKTRRQEISL